MRKVRTAVLLASIMVSALVFSLGLFLPLASDVISENRFASAGARFSPEFEKRFRYIEPVWDTTQWYAQAEKGSYKLSTSLSQYFNLQSRFYNKANGSDVSGVSAPGVLPVFSSSNMNEIASGKQKLAAVQGQTYDVLNDNAAFVMLDNNDTSYNNRVVLELANLTSITNFEASFNGLSFVRRGWTDQNNIPDAGGAFVQVDGYTDLHAPGFLGNYAKDLNDPNAPDKIFWGLGDGSRFQIRGMFNREGYYEFRFDVAVMGIADRRVTLHFGFYIGHANRYINAGGASDKNMPVFDLNLSATDTVNGQGRPVLPGLMRPSHSTAIDEYGNYIPINNDRFFYNFQDQFPSIQYRADRFSVSVAMTDHNKVPRTVPQLGDDTYPSYTFNQLGMYQIDSEMLFPVRILKGYTQGNPQYENRVVRVPNFAAHRYFLDVFGFQAQYWDYEDESYKWFAGTDQRSGAFVSSDITNFKDGTRDFENDPSFKINRTNPETKTASADLAIRSLVGDADLGLAGKLGGLAPVVTNSPPVSLRYNVAHAFADSVDNTGMLSRVAYRKNASAAWNFETPYGNNLFSEYIVGRPFEMAGEYAVIVYYEYNAAEEAGKLYNQIFYFKINNFAADLMIQAHDEDGVIKNYSFADLMGQRLHMSALPVVYKVGGDFFDKVGPFEAAPKLELIFTNFAGTLVEIIRNYNPAVIPQTAAAWYGDDGIYTFRVYYGNNSSISHMPYMDFVVVVDGSPIQNFQCYQGNNTQNKGLEVRNGSGGAIIPNISLFGGGEVTLAWDRKESGVDMLVAKLDFYEFQSGSAIYSDQVNALVLPSQFGVSSKISRSMRIVTTESGFRLADKLSASGLYVITILDAAGVETQYLIIIDTTVASFAQNEAVDPDEVNIKNENTTVGFAKEKLITDLSGNLDGFFADLLENYPILHSSLLNSGIFVKGANAGIKIPIKSAEMSTNGVNYIPVYDRTRDLNVQLVAGNPDTRNNYVRQLVLNPDKSVTYFFRVYDLTGNTAYHYVELNPDPTMALLLEDSVSDIYDNGNISETATVLQNGMISNRDYMTFSFMQATSIEAWRVDQVNIAYYPITYQREYIKQRLDLEGNPVFDGGYPIFDTVINNNYPFSDTPETFTAYSVDEFEPTTAERIAIDINRGPLTRQGLYVIARVCNNAYLDPKSGLTFGQPDIRNYHFIVDNNPIISNQNFETGISVQFGTGVLAKTATHNDFQRINNAKMNPETDRVLRSNVAASVRLPGTQNGGMGSKYGRTYTDGLGITRGELNNSFTIRKGDLLQTENTQSFTFNSLNLVKALEYRAPGEDEFVAQEINQSTVLELAVGGIYRVVLTDGSGGFSWILGADAPKPPEKNRSEILIEIITGGPQGTFALNGGQIAQSTFNTNGNYYSTRIGDKANDRLTFSYVVEDTSNFLQKVNAPPSSISVKRPNGAVTPIGMYERVANETTNQSNLASGRAVYSQYSAGTVTFCEVTLPLASSVIQNLDTILVSLNNGTQQTRTMELTIDNTPPKFNLNRIIESDTFFKNNRASIIANAGGEAAAVTDGTLEIGTGNSLKYPFSLSNEFVFNRASGMYTIDTYSISYFEVDSRLSNISGEKFFEYNSGSFYSIAGMQANQNRFFRIVERDEAGNRADYFVQLRGAEYTDNIDASGVVEYKLDGQGRNRPTGRYITGNLVSEGGIVRGLEMSVESVREFFANNLFFDMTAGNMTIKRLGLSLMLVNGHQRQATPEIFAAALQSMVTAGQGGGGGGSVKFKLNTHLKSFEWELRQITKSTKVASIVASQHSYQYDITFSVDDSLYPSGLAGSDGFIFEVYNLSELNAGPITARTSFWKRSIYVENKNHEYLIAVTDEFGRVVKYSHNGLYGSKMEFNYDDGLSDYIGEDLYVGSGVEVVYSANAYDLDIYKDGVLVFRNGQLLDNELAEYLVYTASISIGGDTKVALHPEEGEITLWDVVAYRRGTGAVWERVFFMYGELPVLKFTNQSGETLVGLENGGITSGIVTVSYSMDGILFNASIEYTRTWTDDKGNVRTDWFPISELMTRFNLTHEGVYVFTVTNALGFKSSAQSYVFTIDDVSNRHYKVSFSYGTDASGAKVYDELEASSVAYSFYYNSAYINIPNFFVRDVPGLNDGSIIKNCISDRYASTLPLRIVPTTNSRRDIIGIGGVVNRYFHEDALNNTYVYRLVSPITQTEIFLAVTWVIACNTVANGFNANLNFVHDATAFFFERTQTEHMSVFYQLAYKPNAVITVGLDKQSLNDTEKNKGNVLYVDYYRDGSTEALGRLHGTQKLTILARDYGSYSFVVSDHAGNVRRFGTANYCTLVNLSRAPLFINETHAQGPVPIADGMIYGDSVSLVVADLPHGISAGSDAFASKLEIYHNDILRPNLGGEASNKEQARTSFALSEPGQYRAVVTYRITGFLPKSIISEYDFVIVSSASQQTFSFVTPTDTEITSIKLNGNEIRTRFPDVFLRQIALSSETGNGTYVVTLRMGRDNIHQYLRTKTFTVVIRSLSRIEVQATIDYGTSTTNPVVISVNPRALFSAYDDCRVIIMCERQIVEDIEISSFGGIALESQQLKIAELTAVGKYMVYVVSYDFDVTKGNVGTVFYSQGFEITKAQNPLGTIIIIVIIILVVIVALVFVRLRMKMRVK